MTSDVREAAAERAAQQRDAVAAGELAVPDESGDQLAIRPEQAAWTPEQLAAFAAMGIKDAPPAELGIFLHVCRQTGLSPFMKQIYLIQRSEKVWDPELRKTVRRPKWTIQVGIGGFRVVRDRAGARDGWAASYEDPIWYDQRGKPYTLWLPGAETPPFACKFVAVKVLASGQSVRYPAILRLEAYADYGEDSSGTKFLRNRWKPDPETMLAKCAEAAALRAMCPQDLAQVYLPEELDRAEQDRQLSETYHARRAPGRRPPVKVTAERVDTPPSGTASDGPATDDGDAVTGTVMGQGNSVDKDLDEQRNTHLAGIHAIFTEHGWGGKSKDHQAVRRGVAAIMGREDDNDPLLPLASLADLDVWQAGRVHERLRQFTDDQVARKRDVHAALGRMAASAKPANEEP